MNTKEIVLELLQVKYTIPKEKDLTTFNYIEEGFIDSLGVIKFICDIEETFNIEFTDEEVMSDKFQVVGYLIELIEKKMS